MRRGLPAIGFTALIISLGSAQSRGTRPRTAGPVDPRLYAAMHWRLIGPFRGGRVVAVAGVPGQPAVFYFGAVGGGVWKTVNAGVTWTPVFNGRTTASVGALAVAPSNPQVIYAGMGEADLRSDLSLGDGVYRSHDGGHTWQFLGLEETRQIARILVDPRNPDTVLVAAMGHAYGPSPWRGIFRSTDGGQHWMKVLFLDDRTGAIDLAADPDDFQTQYAALWRAHRPPWSTYAPISEFGAIYRSSDGGQSWQPVAGRGLPTKAVGRIGLAVLPHSGGRDLYALVDARQGGGLYRSEDGGNTWHLVNADRRLWERGWYFGRICVDPAHPQTLWVPNVALYRSEDGGKHFVPVKGAPGGDDYHDLWIDPADSRRMILASDQGAVVSLDGGRSWSSWYNQPTGQFYHVITDHRFPYWVYGAQQDSGTAAVISRSDYGAITFRDWHPVGGGESGYIAPDPHDPEIVYGGDTYGALHRWNARTGEVVDISPDPLGGFDEQAGRRRLRFTWTSPLVFAPWQPGVLYFGAQYLLESRDDGEHWRRVSPDLTLRPDTNPAEARGVIYAIAPSPSRPQELWVGTDNGLVYLTLDGGQHWENVTPPGLPAWSKISLIDASALDPATAYLAVDRHRLDDDRPYIYRTHDYGRHWTLVTEGLQAPGYVHAVRSDPVRPGLLFAGTETGVFVSFDDGDHWQSLQLDLPRAPVHDLVIEQGDLIVATHGRAFWILDAIGLLRQLQPGLEQQHALLFHPRAAYRLVRSTNTDTPLPPEEPQGENPPDGAILDYWLGEPAQGPVVLEIRTEGGELVRSFSSAASTAGPDLTSIRVAPEWIAPPAALSAAPGAHRFVWDLRYAPPEAFSYSFPIAAVPHRTPAVPQGPRVLPGRYQILLHVNGAVYRTVLEVRADPRRPTASQILRRQSAVLRSLVVEMNRSHRLGQQMEEAAARLRMASGAQPGEQERWESLREALQRLAGEEPGGMRWVNAHLAALLEALDGTDALPTAAQADALARLRSAVDRAARQWERLRAQMPRHAAAPGPDRSR
jgi:photosystem II stability/assembly factor-like uncharacterized protein